MEFHLNSDSKKINHFFEIRFARKMFSSRENDFVMEKQNPPPRGLRESQFGPMFYTLKRKPNPGSLFFHEFLPGMVKSGENDTFLVEFPDFHENGWNLVKMTLFTPKPPSGRHRPKNP